MLFITKQKADISFVMKSGHLYLLLTQINFPLDEIAY